MKYLYSAIVLTVVVTSIALLSRPILPIDETRYVSVAWESFHSGDFLVSHINGATYAHKPPLLFWLIGSIWSLTGVTELGARIVGPLAGLFCLPLVYWLSRRLWPQDQHAASCAPLVLASFAPWLLFAPLTMFDALLTLTVLIGMCGVLKAARGQPGIGWLLAGIGLGLGILSKGPVVFVHILPSALMGAWWYGHVGRNTQGTDPVDAEQNITNQPSAWSWYAGVIAAIVVAGAIGLGWAIPSALAGGKAYAEELLLGQTTGRVVKSFSHQHHLLWYLPLLPLCTLPWLLLGTVWRGLPQIRMDGGVRFVTCWIVGPLAILSLISGKQVHYLMPILPAFALLCGRLLSLAPHGVIAKDLRFLGVGTMFLASMPLFFNHVTLFQQLGSGGIVPDVMTPLFFVCGILLCLCYRDCIESSVLGISGLSAATICLMVGAGSINFWPGFSVNGLAEYVAQSRQPIAWYGEYHAQLNFAGRLHHMQVARTAEDLRSWMEANPNGRVILKLVSEGPVWSEFYETCESPALLAQDGQIPTPRQRELLKQLLVVRTEFADLSKKFQPESIFWIRNGLKWKPFVILSLDDYQHPDGVEQLASEPHQERR